MAAMHGHADVVEMLLGAKASVDATESEWGRGPSWDGIVFLRRWLGKMTLRNSTAKLLQGRFYNTMSLKELLVQLSSSIFAYSNLFPINEMV